MSVIHLPRPLVNQLLRHAQAGADREVCGLIGARNDQATDCYPVANVADDPRRLFQMDPRGQIDAMRHMREAGQELFAIYHSHPDAPAMPSATDLAQAEYPGVAYLIVSLDTKGVLEMRGFRLKDGQFREQILEMLE